MEWTRIETRWYDIVSRLKQPDSLPARPRDDGAGPVGDPTLPVGAGKGDGQHIAARVVS